MKLNYKGIMSALILLVWSIGATTEAATSAAIQNSLTALKEGNARFVAGKSRHQNQDAARRASVAKEQNPFATILTCSDSRVPAELIFDQGLGDVFVVRVAGNVVDTDEAGTVEYGVGHLKTPLLVVMGHSGCGAVKAVLEGAQLHGNLPELVENITPAVARAKAENPNGGAEVLLKSAVKANVLLAIDDLFKRSAEVRALVKSGKLYVEGSVYDLETGAVDWLGMHPEQERLLAYDREMEHVNGSENSISTATHTSEKDLLPKPGEPSGHVTTHQQEVAGKSAGTKTVIEIKTVNWLMATVVILLVTAGCFWCFAKYVMRNWDVSKRISAGFVIILLVLGCVAFAGYEGLHSAVAGFVEYQGDADAAI